MNRDTVTTIVLIALAIGAVVFTAFATWTVLQLLHAIIFVLEVLSTADLTGVTT